MSHTRRSWLLIGGLLLAVTVLFGLSLMSGRVWAPWSAWVDRADPRWAIIFELRLPRTILAVAIGAALGLSGAAMQGYTRNPLADPGVLGVSSMAALGAVLSLYLGLAFTATWLLPACAVLGAAGGVVLMLALAGTTGGTVTFLLAGVILNTVASAGVALALSLAPNPWAAQEIISWLLGSLADRSVDEVRLAVPLIIAGLAVLLTLGRSLDALTLGETGAAALGVNLSAVRVLLAVGVGVASGASVAVTGLIGFVGLIAPHLVRPLVGHRPGALLIPAALAGSALVLAADIVVRLTPSAAEMRLGVATAAVGGPFFLVLLITMRRRIG
ncbi:FecCD family ABC transporter permease [Caulobacter hibisci]|uniref:Iron ABC transporter permease n=1 Tax=Caulobacter hibisci TaxID=2035993 RepID=A0ABS0SWC1_9CAUL|nr:iron ABC transporter permease [Caulobacter hibisci]MBI1682942.1 iron ABC transporter permease [Caulobacter hibisci]